MRAAAVLTALSPVEAGTILPHTDMDKADTRRGTITEVVRPQGRRRTSDTTR